MIFLLLCFLFLPIVFLDRALKLLHVNQFVVDAVFFIFRDIYKHVQEAHTFYDYCRQKSFVPYLESVYCNKWEKEKSTLPTVAFGIKHAPLFSKTVF